MRTFIYPLGILATLAVLLLPAWKMIHLVHSHQQVALISPDSDSTMDVDGGGGSDGKGNG